MKRRSIILSIIFLIAIAGPVYWIYHDSTFVRKNFMNYTGISEFVIESEYYDYHQSFIKVIISSQDKKDLLTKHKFDSTTKSLMGQSECPFIQYDNREFIYFVDRKNGGQYGYILYCLKKIDNSLILYQCFDD